MAGIIDALGVLEEEFPMAFVAITVNVYEVPIIRVLFSYTKKLEGGTDCGGRSAGSDVTV